MTAAEILDYVEEQGISVEEFAYGDFDDQSFLGEWKEVEQYGGEGQGDTWYSIKHFIDHDVYIRTDGFYSSYNGTDFYKGYGKEVKPKQQTVTVYE